MHFRVFSLFFTTVGERNLLEVKRVPSPKKTQKQPAKVVSSAPKPKTSKKASHPLKPEVRKSQRLNPVHLKRSSEPVAHKQVKVNPLTEKNNSRKWVPTYEDHDCDGIPDDQDDDVDNDGLLDRTQDSDWDGLLNHIDDDDDNDGGSRLNNC